MAIGATGMNNQEDSTASKQDEHENDDVMPGFRFHPTEEELVEFYLRRKVEGKRFNVELITFLDLYRYDPWELPALAAIGEKEWYFYVPRDRKYRNGDRPNRVTTSGYWKATGADRMIRSENLRSIGLKKTLVFYSGKAPKGIRTSWIMNEFRLPHLDTQRLQKEVFPFKHSNILTDAEISLCRVYKRAGIEDHPSLPRILPTKAASSSRGSQQARKQQETAIFQQTDGKLSESSPTSSADIGTSLALSHRTSYPIHPLAPGDEMLQQSKQPIFANPNAIDDLHKLVHNYSSCQQSDQSQLHLYNTPPANAPNLLSQFTALQPQTAAYSDRLWEWGAISEAWKDYSNLFK
ncbi:NAC domain-containing protein 35-like isoform X2 [Salvia splendens]|uniref:NAC domain-containing protein 35-like isoform X2 n=1 Tax=Salvia splendens TaxID=180675 RepID=UPI001C257083|nr:NAC domain-containing protein 35-like isoform X2 [Salvia splendens]